MENTRNTLDEGYMFVGTSNITTKYDTNVTVEDLKVNGTLTVDGYVKEEELNEFKNLTNNNFTVLSSHMYSIRGYLLDKIEETTKELRTELSDIRFKLNVSFISLFTMLICLMVYVIQK